METGDLHDNSSVGEGCLSVNAPSATSDRVDDSSRTGNTGPANFYKGCKTPFVVYSMSKQMADCMSWVLSKVAEAEGSDSYSKWPFRSRRASKLYTRP